MLPSQMVITSARQLRSLFGVTDAITVAATYPDTVVRAFAITAPPFHSQSRLPVRSRLLFVTVRRHPHQQIPDQRTARFPVTFALHIMLLKEHNRCCAEVAPVKGFEKDEVGEIRLSSISELALQRGQYYQSTFLIWMKLVVMYNALRAVGESLFGPRFSVAWDHSREREPYSFALLCCLVYGMESASRTYHACQFRGEAKSFLFLEVEGSSRRIKLRSYPCGGTCVAPQHVTGEITRNVSVC